jgi:hypothetical protein
MNVKQKVVIIFTIIMLIAMVLYPPFSFQLSGSKMNLGYDFIFTPPSFEVSEYSKYTGSVDVGILSIQCFVIAFSGVSLSLLFRKRQNEN